MSYVYDNTTTFHYIVDGGITFLCMTSEMVKRRIPFAFLEDIRVRFRKQIGQDANFATAFSLNDDFAPTLRQQMNFFNHDPSSDRITQVKNELSEVKDVMVESIERVMERGERIELLVDKTDRLNQTSFKFEKSSRNLKNAMYYRKMRSYLIGFAVVICVLFIASVALCDGFEFTRCKEWLHHNDLETQAPPPSQPHR
mmetsp:Transcript_1545/g.2959  ORF Transcript_1545/g.2959 Transcript_1545/m.2959 type:complete len:198 (+) Transcript_1545:523-1116(+)